MYIKNTQPFNRLSAIFRIAYRYPKVFVWYPSLITLTGLLISMLLSPIFGSIQKGLSLDLYGSITLVVLYICILSYLSVASLTIIASTIFHGMEHIWHDEPQDDLMTNLRTGVGYIGRYTKLLGWNGLILLIPLILATGCVLFVSINIELANIGFLLSCGLFAYLYIATFANYTHAFLQNDFSFRAFISNTRKIAWKKLCVNVLVFGTLFFVVMCLLIFCEELIAIIYGIDSDNLLSEIVSLSERLQQSNGQIDTMLSTTATGITIQGILELFSLFGQIFFYSMFSHTLAYLLCKGTKEI